MSVYLRGTPVSIRAEFRSIDPITEAATLGDPSGVTFTIQNPDGVDTAYTLGTDPEVTRSSVGVYVCKLAPPAIPGIYGYRAAGSGDVVAVSEGTFTVLESGVLSPVASDEPETGPCTPWITGSDVAGFPNLNVDVGDESDAIVDAAAAIASSLMFEVSGRVFPGLCQRTVRPCRETCGCWQPSSGLGPWAWTTQTLAYGYGGLGYWTNECGDRCGCGSLSTVRLAGYPVREILQVKIDGAVVDASTYRLDEFRDLVRLDAAGPPAVRRAWPACQNLALADTETGTFSVTYRHGVEPPELGKQAAAQIAAELYKAMSGSEKCRLPSNVTRVVRQGVSYDRVTSLANLIRNGQTGLGLVDAFIAAHNPGKINRRPAVFSPDVQQYPRRA